MTRPRVAVLIPGFYEALTANTLLTILKGKRSFQQGH